MKEEERGKVMGDKWPTPPHKWPHPDGGGSIGKDWWPK